LFLIYAVKSQAGILHLLRLFAALSCVLLSYRLIWILQTAASQQRSWFSRFPNREFWEPAAEVGGVSRDEPLPVHGESTDQDIRHRTLRNPGGSSALDVRVPRVMRGLTVRY